MRKFENNKSNKPKYHKEKSVEKTDIINTDDIIYGKNSVLEALSGDRVINKILISKTNN